MCEVRAGVTEHLTDTKVGGQGWGRREGVVGVGGQQACLSLWEESAGEGPAVDVTLSWSQKQQL